MNIYDSIPIPLIFGLIGFVEPCSLGINIIFLNRIKGFMYRPTFKYEINMSKYIKNEGSIALGVVFGLIIPACTISFVLALIGKAILFGNLLEGFLSLFVFGIGLSSPLLLISCFDKSSEIIAKTADRAKKIPWLAGMVLIGVGFLTMLSSSWWTGAGK